MINLVIPNTIVLKGIAIKAKPYIFKTAPSLESYFCEIIVTKINIT
jgi:hypothetical protein